MNTENGTSSHGEALAELVYESGYRVEWLAAKVERHPSHLSAVLHGHRALTRILAERLAPYLGRPAEDLLTLSPKPSEHRRRYKVRPQ